jgi:hypothetical protein
MEQTETERKKIGLKHGNGIFEHGTIKKRNKKNVFEKKKCFLIYFRLKRGNGTFRTELFFNIFYKNQFRLTKIQNIKTNRRKRNISFV